jgi:hypothetical protein
MAELITPGTGLLVCLEYPLFRPAETGGPPHGINSSDYDMLLRGKFVKEMHYVSFSWCDFTWGLTDSHPTDAQAHPQGRRGLRHDFRLASQGGLQVVNGKEVLYKLYKMWGK